MKRLKNSKFFLWFGKGTKAQVFVKKSAAVAVAFLMCYLVGYGFGALLRVIV